MRGHACRTIDLLAASSLGPPEQQRGAHKAQACVRAQIASLFLISRAIEVLALNATKGAVFFFGSNPTQPCPFLPNPLPPSSIYFLVEVAWLFWLQHSGLLYLLVKATMGPRVRNTKGSFWGPISPICQEEPLMGHLRRRAGALEGCNRSRTYESLEWMNLTIVAWN